MKRNVLLPLGGRRSAISSRTYSSLCDRLHRELTSRILPLNFDYLHTQPSHLLSLTLADLLPGTLVWPCVHTALPSVTRAFRMPAGHHLAYFPPQVTLSQLLPDGTDVLHSPGVPFERRLWAGGSVRFPVTRGLILNGARAVCIETIRDVMVKGREGAEKVMVKIERRMAVVQEEEEEGSIRERIWKDTEDEIGHAAVIESRNLAFMRKKTQGELHYDKMNFDTCQRVIKRFRNLLVHGPLTLTLLLTVLEAHLAKSDQIITAFDYRNVAPLYVDEPLTICGKPKSGKDDVWDVWIEGKNGGLAVRGTAFTSPVSLTALTFVQSALVYGGLLSGRYVIFRPGLVFKQLPEAWRLFSSFFMTGPRLDFILDIYFMFKYGSALETASPRFSSPGDFFTYVFFVATVITLTAGCLLDDVIFTHALIIAFVYTFAQDNQGRKASFFVVQLPVEFLPWAMLTWTLVLSGWHAAFSESMGIVAAHMYDFFSRIYPTFGGGRNYIITPTVVRRIFSAHMPPSQHRAYGTAYRPIPEEQNPSQGWGSFQSPWSSRGPGRRLGGG
ncbi:Der1-like family-domain-containing protein [Aspergillus pseudotamarii]|uniref:Der1-like family-domain-containing protein n=1 Tax=Aspergillus pseudotamarii TaxID=132259 RepID=A0A5N6SEU2_ASPPS|nr:Der1-like family-domain-containing protein [Aspergillus pseudotamarii]KAE8132201.1 Der1-like family-domain-containing protein [Aspergillus pseudotamarii]